MDKLEIKTHHLNIKKFKDSDIVEEYTHWPNDKELMRYREQRQKRHTLETSKNYLSSFAGTLKFFLTVKTKEGNTTGVITIYQDIYNRICDIGILLGLLIARGKEFGFEVLNLVFKWIEINLKPERLQRVQCQQINLC